MSSLKTTAPATPARGSESSGQMDASLAGRPIVDGPIGPGTILLDRYAIVGVIGEGGMGTVYLAEDREQDRRLAIKVLSEEWSTNRFVVRRFCAEARTAGSIGHRNIVRVDDAGVFADGRPYVVMEHVEGRDLKHELAARRNLPPLRACTIMRQVCLAVGAVHALGVIHRDLKPGNIMLVPQPGGGELVKVLDFGIAANTSATGLHGERVKRPAWTLGSPEYMAPEQATGDMPSPALDIYAIGVTLYEMLTGALPLTAEHSFELLAFKRHNPAPSLRERAPELPDSLVALVDQCLAIDPDKRPHDTAAVIARLDAVLGELRGEPILVIEEPARTRGGGLRWIPAALGLAAAAVVAALFDGRAMIIGASLPAALVERETPVLVELECDPEPEVLAPSSPSTASALPDPTLVADNPGVHGKSRPARAEDVGVDAPPLPQDRTLTGAPAVVAEPPAALEAPPPASELADGGPAHSTARCERVRKAAEEARSAHQWSTLRNHSRSEECWEDPTVPSKLQTKAMMELGDYAGCVAVGSGLNDPDVVAWVQLCRIRGGA